MNNLCCHHSLPIWKLSSPHFSSNTSRFGCPLCFLCGPHPNALRALILPRLPPCSADTLLTSSGLQHPMPGHPSLRVSFPHYSGSNIASPPLSPQDTPTQGCPSHAAQGWELILLPANLSICYHSL